MQLPQSGISRYETFMNAHTPSGIQFSDEEHGVYQTDQGVTELEVKYYWTQIYLRITLNSIHHELYDKNKPSKLQTNSFSSYICAASVAHADLLQNSNSRFKRF